MISSLIEYSAVSAKARAMCGKLMTDADWNELLELRELRAIWDYLRRRSAWSCVSLLPDGEDAGAITGALTAQLEQDCHHLGMFLDREDRNSIELFLHYQELDRGLTSDDYQRWWKTIGKEGAGLRRIVGAEADALNLVYILRLRRFPGSASRAPELLIPVRDALHPYLVSQLLQAPDDATVLSILRGTQWSDAFRSLEPGDLEREYQQYLNTFSHHILNSSAPGLSVVLALLTLKDMERCKLVRIIGAAARGANPETVV